MRLEGVHHVTAITGDVLKNVDFYTRVLGLRLVGKSVNQDDPSVYHVFFSDEHGRPGADITFFEYRGAARGRAGSGMVHRVLWRVTGEPALAFWEQRLADAGVATQRAEGSFRFADPEGLEHELIVSATGDEPLSARAPEISSEHALQGFDGVRAYSADPARSADLLAGTLGFTIDDGSRWSVRGQSRGSFYAYDPPPEGVTPMQGAGSVHHVAFASQPQEQEDWRSRVAAAGARPTPVIDRFYFRSVYFREPSGVLFEIATIGPGFAVDEDAAHLGEHLSLPPRLEPMRARLEAALTPLPAPERAPAPSPART